jgi:coproporphyrinogen III oxidase
MRDRAVKLFHDLQERICSRLTEIDGQKTFMVDQWTRDNLDGQDGGGGITRVISDGAVFEKGGVNTSVVYGHLPVEMSKRLVGSEKESPFFATGVSLVIHPFSPMVPTVHANFRYLEVEDKAWFGGGADLTPYYLFEEDALHFHQTIKAACDLHSLEFYSKAKKRCDEYFYLPHRKETRGVGGIFFDYLGKDEPKRIEDYFKFVSMLADAFLPAYEPIVFRCKDLPWGEKEKKFQLLRRGRYVEFNLIFDLGTQFGLKTGGRTESILMSLPPVVNWDYDAQVELGSREYELLEILKNPRDWL